MNEYTCIIKRNNRIIFQCNTMALSPEQAISRAKYRYAKQEVPESKIRSFLSSLTRECTCTCTESKPEPPKLKQPEPKRVQLSLFGEDFNNKLNNALDTLTTRCSDDKKE